jgi:hypothetical protein
VTAATADGSRTELWWAALGGGLVVIVCVVILLALMSAFVRDIDGQLRKATDAARRTAGHVHAADQISEAARLIEDLGTELALQLAVLAGTGGAAP